MMKATSVIKTILIMEAKKEQLEESQKALGEFFKLASYLLGEEAPYDANEIPTDNPYYEEAKGIAEELELDWKNLKHEDSNRIVLNLLTDYFCAIKTDEDYLPVLSISFKKKTA